MSVDSVLLRVIAETLGVDARRLAAGDRFADLGRTSFQEIELLTEIEDRFRVQLDFDHFCGLATVGELVGAVNAAVREGGGPRTGAGSR
jgi:acyl carrier protein